MADENHLTVSAIVKEQCMEIPVQISYDSAYVITSRVLRSSTSKQKRHLFQDNLDRMQQVSGQDLETGDAIEGFLIDFLKGSSVYFSTTLINHNVTNPNRVNVELPTEILDVIDKLTTEVKKIKEEKGFHFPLYLVGNAFKSHNVNSQVYMYCIKSGAVLVMATGIKGDIVPRLDEWVLSFRFTPITFLNFELEAEHIPKTILNNPLLKKVNYLVSVIPSFSQPSCPNC